MLDAVHQDIVLNVKIDETVTDETKSRNEITKSLNETIRDLVWWALYNFIFPKVGTRLDTEWYQAIIICSLLLFSRFKPCQYSRGKNIYYTVGNYAARPVLNLRSPLEL